MSFSPNAVSQAPQRNYGACWFIAMALVFAVGMLGTTLPTPLYSLYQQRLGISDLLVTVIFATYAFGVLGALVLTGSWSDQVGRRPMIAGGLLFSAASSLLFLRGGSLWLLLFGRGLSGLSAGLLTATATVTIIELAPERQKVHAAMLAAAANMGGLGLGPLLAGAFSQYLPWPMRLTYLVHLGMIAVAAGMLQGCPETVERPSRLRLRRQTLRLPAAVRAAFLPAAVASFAGFALLGLLTSLEPAIAGRIIGVTNRALIGALVFLVFMASLCGQILQRRLASSRQLPVSCVVLILGAGLLAGSIAFSSFALLIFGAMVSGLGQGGIFAASILAVTAASPANERAEVTSLLFIVIYLAVALPVLGLGVAADAVGLRAAGITFTVLVMLTSIAALAVLIRRRPDTLS